MNASINIFNKKIINGEIVGDILAESSVSDLSVEATVHIGGSTCIGGSLTVFGRTNLNNTFVVVDERSQCKAHSSSWYKIVSESYKDLVNNLSGNDVNKNIFKGNLHL